MDKIYGDQKPKCHFWRARSKSRVLCLPPAFNIIKGVGRPPKPPRQPELCTPPNPYPVSGTSSFPAPSLSELNKQESLFVLAPPAAAGAQIKPCLNYFYWLRRPRPLISITVTGRKGPEAEGQTPWSVGEKPSSSWFYFLVEWGQGGWPGGVIQKSLKPSPQGCLWHG